MVAAGIPGGVGSKLREARERRGVSLRTIANATRISVAALEALERNDVSRLPGGIFSRAFVRSYATEVGLDPEATIQEFIAQFPHDSVTAGHPTSVKHDDDEKLESNRRMASALIKLVGVSLVVAGVLLYFATTGRRATARHPASAAPVGAVAPTAGTGVPAASDDKFSVVISASGRSFVTATVDGQHTIEREMQAGEHEALIVRRDIVLSAGDAGVVSLALDGADAKPLGRAGESATLHLTTEDVKTGLATR
jgi:transcriptional regulator with XRE-family HTH domain